MKSAKITSVALALAIAASIPASIPAAAAETTTSTAAVSASTASAKTYKTDSIIKSSGYKTAYTSRYAYKTLSSKEKTLYKSIVAAVKDLESVVTLPSGITDNQIMKVYSLVFNEEPQLFWMGSGYTKGSDYLYVSYKTNDLDEIEKMQKAMNKQTSSLLAKAKKYSSTYNKLKVFYDYIVLNNDFMLEDADNSFNSTVYAGLTKKESLQCAGYAKTMQYLCDLAGIECMVVTGTNKSGDSHAWNVVKCGDGYYNLDPTWGDPKNSFGSSYISYMFFLVPDAWIKNISHYNVNVVTRANGTKVKLFTPPSCTKTKYNYFIKSGLNYSSASKGYTGLKAQVKKAVAAKSNVAEIRVSSKSAYTTLTSSSYQSKLQSYAKSLSSNVSSVKVQYKSVTAGTYVVHYDITYKK
ncbi:MAG: transglutaminase domain-containing protein [Oscillospiraceae bacterium]|nr:transglutaminase domain-containing protein [Oscillospiraceae bacterium]MDY2848248.1 transglutaminase domain-containing protein [Oscillospiraceae bacterium]